MARLPAKTWKNTWKNTWKEQRRVLLSRGAEREPTAILVGARRSVQDVAVETPGEAAAQATSEHATDRRARPGRMARLLLVAAAILLGQAVLFGPSLVGSKLLLPLDILAQRNHYLPHTAGLSDVQPENFVLSDLVLHAEPTRVFAAQELRQGRFPWWNPYAFAGAPHVLMRFSPFMLLRILTPSPWVLPWVQVLVALLAGFGAYALARKTLALGFRPSAIAGCCYPLCAYFVFWLGYGHTWSLAWLPWLLVAEDRVVRGKRAGAGLLVALLTCLTLISGPLDTAAQELIVAGLFALWSFLASHGRAWRSRANLRALALVLLGWCAGILLAAPEILSLSAYTQTGQRMIRRGQGALERPPGSLAALPLLALPSFEGTPKEHGVSIAPAHHRNPMEDLPMGYAGALALLLLAPLAWQSRRHRQAVLFFSGLALLGLGWSVGLPGLTAVLRLPGLNMMSHNRLLFATSLSIMAMAAIGLDAIEQGHVRWRAWQYLPLLAAAGLAVASGLRMVWVPGSLATRFADAVRATESVGWVHDSASLERARASWCYGHAVGTLLCGLVVLAWLLLRARGTAPRRAVPLLGALMAADLLWFGHGWNVQSEPGLYYPRIPLLEQLAKSDAGRVLGYDCLPAVLAQTHGLRDVRGYDAVDPQRLVTLLTKVAGPTSLALPYAAVQWYVPALTIEPPGSVRLPPVLDMLNVRTVIFRGRPPADITPALSGGDYWALSNPRALPRVFVPRRAVYVPSSKERLAELASPDFDAREVAFIEEQPVAEPVATPTEARGRVEITSEIPTRITLSADMETPGLVVLADLYDAGWRAFRDGQPTPILRVNHALRGMQVPPGKSRIELRYRPAGLDAGLLLAGLGLLVLLAWAGALWMVRGRPDSTAAEQTPVTPSS